MPRRLLAIILIAALTISPLMAEAELSYEPYGEEEFPIWTMKLRRAESIFFGSMVITFPVAMLAWNLMEYVGWVGAESPIEAFGWQLLMAGGLSLTISTADWIIGEVRGE